MQEISWKDNLRVAWFGSFLTGASISLVVPFMPIFVEQLGIEGDQVAFYAGLAISVSAVSAALVSPIWGILADKYGRKPMMIRAGLAMTITMGGLAFVPNIYWLIFLRLLNGVFTGFVPNATALIASQVPKDKSGAAQQEVGGRSKGVGHEVLLSGGLVVSAGSDVMTSIVAWRTPSGVGEEAVAATGRPSSRAAAAVVAPMATNRVVDGGGPSSSRIARVVDGAVSTTASTPPVAHVLPMPGGRSQVSAVTVV